MANVTSVNRLGQQSAYLTDLSPVTASDSTEQDNLKVSLQSFDDMETDSPFEDQSYRLTDGGLITPETQYGAVVNAGFADANGLQLGDQLSFETESGKTVTLRLSVNILPEMKTGRKSPLLPFIGWRIRSISIIQLIWNCLVTEGFIKSLLI